VIEAFRPGIFVGGFFAGCTQSGMDLEGSLGRGGRLVERVVFGGLCTDTCMSS
jgi:hypothetical protein